MPSKFSTVFCLDECLNYRALQHITFNYTIFYMETTEESKISQDRTFLQMILQYVVLLLKYKYMIIIGTTLSAILVVVYAILSLKLPSEQSPMPNIYKSYGVVLFQEDGNSGSMSAMLSAFGVNSSSSGSSASQLAMHILNSRPYMDNVIEHFGLIEKMNIHNNKKTMSRRFLRMSSEFSFNQEAGALSIAFTSTNPVFAAEVVNYEISLLQTWFLEQSIAIRSNELSLMEESWKNYLQI